MNDEARKRGSDLMGGPEPGQKDAGVMGRPEPDEEGADVQGGPEHRTGEVMAGRSRTTVRRT
jgi:hypothetical protein